MTKHGMTKYRKTLLSITLLFSSASFAVASELPDAQKLFKQKCSLCHALDKKKLGPAVNSMSSEAQVLRETISKGQGMMPTFAGKLTGAEIDALVDYLLANQ